MLPILQVVTKNEDHLKIKRPASVFLEAMFVKYGIDSRVIVYADLGPLFKDAPGFILKKFELDKKLSKEDLKELKRLMGMKVAPKPVAPKPVAPKPVPKAVPVKPKTAYPINKPKGTGKTQ